jgi:hypothetical protein
MTTLLNNIEEDNKQKMDKYKFHSPHASYIAGLIDGDGCIFIRKIKDGFQSGISITQVRTNILQIIMYHFGGSITTSKNRNNHITEELVNIRNQYNLIIRSNEYEILLNYVKDSFIIKHLQIECLYEMNKLTNKINKVEQKQELFEKCTLYNKEKTIDISQFSKLNIEYIQGLFDAEGSICIFQKETKNSYRISITQSNHPEILVEIQKYLQLGNIGSDEKFYIYNKKDCLTFISLMKTGCIVKYNQLCSLEEFLNTSDKSIRKKCIEKIYEEKHLCEYFTNVNQTKENKEQFYKSCFWREQKKLICKEILKNNIYKMKSENMKGIKNHNYGKEKSEETKKKMSVAIRNSKKGVSDEIILQVKEYISQGLKNVEIQKIMNLPRHTVSRIKNNIIQCRII